MSITSANAVLTLAIATIFPNPVQLQGFGTDDIYDVPSIRTAELAMGVDGILSAGFIFVMIPQTIVLQADSESNDLFDAWNSQEQAASEKYAASGLIKLPGIATKFTQTRGFLSSYKPVPQAKKSLQPRTYEITWQRISPSPT